MENMKCKQGVWHRLIFSVQKKFNLYGADGWDYYWHDLGTEPNIFTTRQMGGYSVMIWYCFSNHGKGPILYLNARVDAKEYQKVVESEPMPWEANTYGQTWEFKQDIAPLPMESMIRKLLFDYGIDVLEWPARSPDSTAIEN